MALEPTLCYIKIDKNTKNHILTLEKMGFDASVTTYNEAVETHGLNVRTKRRDFDIILIECSGIIEELDLSVGDGSDGNSIEPVKNLIRDKIMIHYNGSITYSNGHEIKKVWGVVMPKRIPGLTYVDREKPIDFSFLVVHKFEDMQFNTVTDPDDIAEQLS